MFKPSNPQIELLQQEINNNQNRIDELFDEIRELKHTKANISKLKKRISEINSEISSLTKERKESARKIADIRKQLSNSPIESIEMQSKKLSVDIDNKQKVIQCLIDEDFHSFINTMNDNNTTEIHLWSNRATTPIMDDFYNDDTKDFLVATGVIYSNQRELGLVITKNYPVTRASIAAPTMTELKTYQKSRYAPERMLPLIKEIKKYNCKDMAYGQKVAFETPLPLGGQTYANQTGYGWEWDWSGGYGDYTEGTFYGEVTTFLIIGFIRY